MVPANQCQSGQKIEATCVNQYNLELLKAATGITGERSGHYLPQKNPAYPLTLAI